MPLSGLHVLRYRPTPRLLRIAQMLDKEEQLGEALRWVLAEPDRTATMATKEIGVDTLR